MDAEYTITTSESHDISHEEHDNYTNAMLSWDSTASPPLPNTFAYDHNLPHPPSFTEHDNTKHYFVIQTTTASYYHRALSEPKTAAGEGRTIGIGDQVIFEHNCGVVWRIVRTMRWDRMNAVLRLENKDFPHIALEIKKVWIDTDKMETNYRMVHTEVEWDTCISI